MRKTVTTKIHLPASEVRDLILEYLGIADDTAQFTFHDSNGDTYDLAHVVVTEEYDEEGDTTHA